MKAGTTSFTQTLHQFGCWSIHHGLHVNRGQEQYINMTKWNTLSDTEQAWGRGNFSVKYTIGRVMELAHSKGLPLLYYFNDSLNAFSQLDSLPYVPQVTQFDLLLEQYPSAKFVLMKRGIESHITSIGRWGALREHLIERNIPYLPEGQGAEDTELAKWITGHYERVRDHFTRFTDPDQYLEIQLEDGNDFNTDKLRHFLHCEGANVAMRQMNHNPPRKPKYIANPRNNGNQSNTGSWGKGMSGKVNGGFDELNKLQSVRNRWVHTIRWPSSADVMYVWFAWESKVSCCVCQLFKPCKMIYILL